MKKIFKKNTYGSLQKAWSLELKRVAYYVTISTR